MNDDEIRIKFASIQFSIAYTNVNHKALKVDLWPSETATLSNAIVKWKKGKRAVC